MTLKSFTIPILLLIQTFYCWWCFFKAKELPYDENFGILVHAIVISIVMWVILRMVRAWLNVWAQFPGYIFWSWMLIGSPITYVLAFIYYNDLFGHLAL